MATKDSVQKFKILPRLTLFECLRENLRLSGSIGGCKNIRAALEREAGRLEIGHCRESEAQGTPAAG